MRTCVMITESLYTLFMVEFIQSFCTFKIAEKFSRSVGRIVTVFILDTLYQLLQWVERIWGSWVPFLLWPPAFYWLCQYNETGWDRGLVLPALSCVWQHVKLSDVSLGTRPRYSLVADEDVKKSNKQKAMSRKT